MNASIRSVAASLAALLALPGLAPAIEVVNDFSDGLQSWRFDFGAAITPNLTQNPNEGSPGNPMGALQMDMTFMSSFGGDNRYAFTGDVFFPGRDLTGFSALQFDLKIGDGAALDAFGNHGFMQFVSRETDNYNFNSVLGENLAPPTGEWRTYTIDAAGVDTMTETRAFTLQLYGGPDQNIDGGITLFLDNIRLIPEPTALLIAATGCVAAYARRKR